MKHLLKLLLPLLLCGACPVIATTSCPSVRISSAEYIRGTEAVRRLPELRKWSGTHSFQVAFSPKNEVRSVVHGHCYWTVSVYADRPERLELWHIFAIDSRGHVALVDNPIDGTFVPLKHLRQIDQP
jgi:hypothetical protein